MELCRLQSVQNSTFDRAMELYRVSFPAHEQRESASQEACMDLAEYHFDLIRDDGVWAGMILYWETETFLYVEHFCIFPDLRGRSYGRKALERLAEKGKTIILEIDPPVDEISIRRKGFYERAGFVPNPFPHMHPPYHAGNTGHKLVVMSYPQELPEDAYREFARYLRDHVMKGCGTDESRAMDVER